jgi:3-phenylpropionate/trans-cinnamate dioxygenase ferredoxin reductase subunit
MERYKYLIIGGGMTGDAAAHGIRSVDSDGSIGLIGAEPDRPYNRPPLTKGLWKGDALDSIWRKAPDGVSSHFGVRIVSVDPGKKQATDAKGGSYSWEKLLLATGGVPRTPFGESDGIIYYRTLADYRRLRADTEKGERFAIVGGGFIGSEIAAALAMNHKRVTMVLRGKEIGEHLFPPALAHFISEQYRQKGVELLIGKEVSQIEQRGKQFGVKLKTGEDIPVDAVVAGAGIEPNVELARKAGLTIENGIVVDELLRTSNQDIYAAGDVASFFNPALGKRIRVEHEDNANTMGKAAGQNMAGTGESYRHLPFFYSDLFEFGYEAVGELDSRLETFADWKQPNKEGVVYYLRDGRVRGVLLWNVWGKVDVARELIAKPGPFNAENLKGRL